MAEFKVKKLGLVCGGTGIAVMYPVNIFVKDYRIITIR